jgi:RNA polymerase sigma-70 factor, ECF subfamily
MLAREMSEPAKIEVISPPGAPEDGELVARALGGESWAEEMLFRRHVRAVSATATRLLGDPEEAQDVVQESFALAFERLRDLRDPRAFKGWLLTIAVSRVHRVFRKQRIARLFGLGSDRGLAELASETVAPDVRAELALLDVHLRRLPARERIAWMLKHVEGLELTEVAAACDCSLATAKRRIASAQARLQRRLGGPDAR